MHVVFASCGNDSIALIQYAYEKGLFDVTIIYSDTGWAADWWEKRVKRVEEWARNLGFTFIRTKSIGMEALVRKKNAWPRQGIQFCTTELKIEPSKKMLDEIDPGKNAICLIGVRRVESQARKFFPEYVESHPNQGGRRQWAPLVDYTDVMRNDLIIRAGFDVLPHRSMECFPCINSNRKDLLLLDKDEKRIDYIEQLEKELGVTSNGKPRTMFRPYKYMGATGIREIVRWARSRRGKFDPDDGTGGGNCDGGFCDL